MIYNKKLPSWCALLLINLALLALYLFFLSRTDFLAGSRLKVIDSLFELRPKFVSHATKTDRVVVIGVDDASYRKMNRAWPWGREMFALFLDHLRALEPKVVGLDFSFIGKGPDPAADQWLAEAIKKTENTVLISYFDKDGGYVVPLDIFKESALGHGFANKPLDRDAVVRRFKMNVELSQNKGQVFSFASQVASAYSDDIAEQTRPLKNADADKPLWLSYRYKPESFRYFSFWEVMMDQVPKDRIQGKIVLVGPISMIFHDHNATPIGIMQGTYSIANEILMILDNDFIQEVALPIQWLFLLFLTIVFTLLFNRSKYVIKLVLFLISEAVFYGVCLFLFVGHNLLLEPLPGMLVIAVTYLVTSFYKGLSTFLENAMLQKLVITDSLTGIYDHRYLTFKLKAEFNWRRETKSEFFFVMVDVDFFKKVNDEYGHEEGNAVLVAIAKILKGGVRGSDVVARYGGEEFSLILFDSDEKGALQSVERIRATVEAHKFTSARGPFKVTISAGICSNKNTDVKTPEDLIKCADQALYEAKNSGRNRICIYSTH